MNFAEVQTQVAVLIKVIESDAFTFCDRILNLILIISLFVGKLWCTLVLSSRNAQRIVKLLRLVKQIENTDLLLRPHCSWRVFLQFLLFYRLNL